MKKDIENFQKTVWAYHKKNRRNFPWRETHDPYHILVSEIMLQQTQTNRVVPKYNEFLKKFPTVEKLATAPLRDVLHLWQGLGYNRRARFLHECAKTLKTNYNSTFPKDFGMLKKLPGIGQSTAGAILNFAFNIPTSFIETNIRTVYIHHFFNDETKNVTDKDLMKQIHETMDVKNPREWFYALYDYGTFLKLTLAHDPAKRSAIYKKQSKFKGSFREKRSITLKLLLESPLSETDLSKHLVKQDLIKKDSNETKQILDSLIKDKLIIKKTKGQKTIYEVI